MESNSLCGGSGRSGLIHAPERLIAALPAKLLIRLLLLYCSFIPDGGLRL